MLEYLYVVILIGVISIILYNMPVYVQSEYEGRYYLVSNTKDKQYVANTIGELNKRIDILLHDLKINYNNHYLKYYDNVKLLIERFNSNSFGENFLKLGTSFTINKGDFIALCVKNNEGIHDLNTLMYVVLHELAHIGSKDFGHTPEFIRFFKFLISTAIKLDLYVYIDYSKDPVNYCGLNLNSSV
jgi:hypothetical protein